MVDFRREFRNHGRAFCIREGVATTWRRDFEENSKRTIAASNISQEAYTGNCYRFETGPDSLLLTRSFVFSPVMFPILRFDIKEYTAGQESIKLRKPSTRSRFQKRSPFWRPSNGFLDFCDSPYRSPKMAE